MRGEENRNDDPAITSEQDAEKVADKLGAVRERIATAQRDANGRFMKGFSGNASGRPKELAEVRELAATFTTDAVATLAQIMLNPLSEDKERRASAEALLDRAWGRAPQAVELAGKGGGPIQHEDKTPALTSEQRGRKLIEMLNQVAALAGKGESGGDTESTDPKTETTERERP